MAIASALGTRNADNSASIVTPSRTGSYLEAYVLPLGGAKLATYAEEGSYFTSYNVTDGTGIAGHAAPVQADLSTKPFIHLYNSSATKFVTIDFIRIRMTAIGAGASTTNVTTWVDNNGASSRTSGGTLQVPVNTNPGNSTAYAGTIYAGGTLVGAIGTGEIRSDAVTVRSVVSVVQDHYVFSFGGGVQAYPSANVTTGTTVNSVAIALAAVCVPPLGNFKFVMWGTSQSGAHSAEYVMGLWQR